MFGTNKRAVETFIVSKPLQTTMPVTGSLVNTTTGNVNLADGQIGIVNPSMYGTVPTWNFVDATPTIAEAQALQFVQGTQYSANLSGAVVKYPLWARPYETTPAIDGKNKDIKVTKQAYLSGAHDLFQIADVDAAVGKVTAEDNTTYQIHIKYGGTRNEEFFSNEQASGLRAVYTSPDYTALGYNAVQARSELLTTLAAQINYNSAGLSGLGGRYKGSDPVVAFAMGEATGTGATAVSGLAVGTVITVMKSNGVGRSITLTAEMLVSLQAAVAASPALTHILVADLTDIGTWANGSVKALWVMALDEATAYIDYIPQRKVYLKVALPQGFVTSVKDVKIQAGREGQGYGRVLDLRYKATQGQRKYFNQHTLDPIINFPSPIDENTAYVTYNVTFANSMQIDVANVSVSPHKVLICVPAETTPSVVNPLIATLDSTINSWLTSTGNSAIITI